MSTDDDIVPTLLEMPSSLNDAIRKLEIAADEITKLRAERYQLIADLADMKARAMRGEAAARDMRERAAHAGYVACAETRHVTLGNSVSAAIMALPFKAPALLATDRGGE